MKLWHDDIRPAPEGWEWARTNDEAIAYLEKFPVEEISLDHDLGLDYIELPEDPDELITVLQLRGQADENGFHLAVWMCYNEKLPEKITIHSWNPDGAKRMAAVFNDYGKDVEIKPFVL